MCGGCACGNVEFLWRNVDYSLVPRACSCDYCRAREAAWVSKSGTAVEVTVRNPALHRVAEQGSMQARFHECAHCGQVVWVGMRLDDEVHGALNVQCLRDRARFPQPRPVELTGLSPEEKRTRWHQNWCCPVTVEPPDDDLL